MLNFYYNIKISDSEIRTFNTENLSNHFFHSRYYPVCFENLLTSKTDELLLSINSLSLPKFDNAVFGILLDNEDTEHKKNFYTKIEDTINKIIN